MKYRVLGVAAAIMCLGLVAANAMAGSGERFRGRWYSDATGHSGPMRATLRYQDDGAIDATFAGRFAVVVPFIYRTKLMPTGYGTYAATRKLAFFGEYRMEAALSGDRFSGGFTAGEDRGRFEMQRTR